MARRSGIALLVLAALCLAPTFVAPNRSPAPVEATKDHCVDTARVAAIAAGLTPLALEQPASAYDSVVAMLQSWLVGGIALVLIYGAAFVAALANPLTKRRQEVKAEVDAIKKVLPGSWAEGRVPLSSEIKSINGRSATSLDADGFKAELERRPLQLQVHLAQGDLESAVSQSPAQPQKTEGGRGSTLAHVSKAPSGQIGEKDAPVQDATSEGEAEHETAKAADPLPTTTMASPPVPSAGPAAGSSDFEHLQKDFDALSQKLQEREKELLTAEGELAKAKGEVQELRTKLALREKEKKDLLQDAKRDPLPSVSEVELDEVKGQLANALQDLAIARSQAEQLKQRTEELEDARKELMEKDVKLVETDRPGATSSAPPQSPDSAASFEVTPAYWEHVEIHALQEELAQRDAELKALRTDLAAAYAKLKEGDQKLRVTAPKSATTLGFRLQKWLVYEVVKGSWAESVGLKLGDRLQLVQEMQVTKMGKEQLKEAWSQRPLQLTFRAASKTEQEGMASTKIQANWRRKKAQEKVGQLGKAAGDLGPELDTFTLLAEVEDLGLTLELWPPAPKVLVCRVQREGWAMKAGIKAGYQLLMVQKQSLQSFQDRQSFRRLWKERPLELTLCPGSKEDVQRIASTKIQHGWRSREPKPKGVEMADQTKRAGGPMPLAAGEAAAFPAASMDRPWEKLETNSLQQLQDELMQKQLELKKLKQDLVHSESSFEKSLEQISVESSESAVEVASLKAQLALEQSKVAKIQNEGASKATSAHAKFLVEQRKAETLETRLVETEVIHQEQISEITEFLEARRRELQLEDIDFSKLRHPPDVPNEVERLKAALAEEQERVSSAERKLVKGWSDQRAIDLKWQAEVAARDESLEAMQKEVSKAEWWASLSSSPELKDLVGLKTELEEERDKNLRTERRLEEVQADSKKGECEKLQASLNKEEARHLQLQLALTKAQIEDETLRNADLEIPTTPTDKAVKAEELLRLNLQLQELKGELQETKVQGPSRTAETRRKAEGFWCRTSVPVVKVLSREASDNWFDGITGLLTPGWGVDDGLRTKLAVALMRALQDGSLQQHLDKAPRWAALRGDGSETMIPLVSLKTRWFNSPNQTGLTWFNASTIQNLGLVCTLFLCSPGYRFLTRTRGHTLFVSPVFSAKTWGIRGFPFTDLGDPVASQPAAGCFQRFL
ncbi:unnamed protein product [Cladocopium goreaui]|uniref:Uncharacterized protein n=1 Tax=Cladocopium goreaui TaxID=2562237 RepID=A0A9P1CVN3_9DINO|nr:unnamed protein product [Cladocopium goreaui]